MIHFKCKVHRAQRRYRRTGNTYGNRSTNAVNNCILTEKTIPQMFMKKTDFNSCSVDSRNKITTSCFFFHFQNMCIVLVLYSMVG